MLDCVFCGIVSGNIPAKEVVRTSYAVVFQDLEPKAPAHLLVVPTRHAASLTDFTISAPPDEVGELFALASKVGREVSPAGYRVVVNEGSDGGQTVAHLHVHVLAGRQLAWPPG